MKKRTKYTKSKRNTRYKKPMLDDGGYIYDDTKSEFANNIAMNEYLSEKQRTAIDDQYASVNSGIELEKENTGVSAAKGGVSGFSTGMSIAGPVGGAVGAVLGAGAGMFTANKRNIDKFNQQQGLKDQQRIAKEEITTKDKQIQKDAYANVLDNYNTKGNKDVQYFEEGGNLATPNVYAKNGGKLKPLSNDVDKIEGKSHAQGGVDLAINGKVIAEGEGEEIIKDDNMVFSDKLGYAKTAEKLGKLKGKFEKDVNSKDPHKRNTAIRTIQNTDKKLNNLFAQQEASKLSESKVMENGGILSDPPIKKPIYNDSTSLQADNRFANYEFESIEVNKMKETNKLNVPHYEDDFSLPSSYSPNYNNKMDINRREKMKLADGGKILAASQFALPLIENAYNAKLIKETPQLTRHETLKPQLQKAEQLETEFDINPQLVDINNQTKQFNTSIDRGTNNANVGRANKIMAHVKNIEQTNKLRGQKANIETELTNKNKLNKQQVDGKNLANINAYDKTNADNRYSDEMLEFKRKDEIAGRKSENVARLVEDLTTGVGAVNEMKLDKEKIWTNLKSYDSGVQAKMLNDKKFVNTYLMGNESRQNEFKEMIKGRPDAVIQYNRMFPNNMLKPDGLVDGMKSNYNDITKGVGSFNNYANKPQ